MQEVANNAVRNNVSPYTPGVAEVMDIVRPGADSRDVLAMASSRFYGLDLDQSQTILPQPASLVGAGAGSVFKIFTAAAALEQGYNLDAKLPAPVAFGPDDLRNTLGEVLADNGLRQLRIAETEKYAHVELSTPRTRPFVYFAFTRVGQTGVSGICSTRAMVTLPSCRSAASRQPGCQSSSGPERGPA